MKRKMFLNFFCFFLAITGKALAADITITGETMVNSSTTFTYYATPPTPVAPGTTYTWNITDATIVEQNTDPNAGPIYCVVRFPRVLGQNVLSISDNQGNSGSLDIIMNGFSLAYQQLAAIYNKLFMIA